MYNAKKFFACKFLLYINVLNTLLADTSLLNCLIYGLPFGFKCIKYIDKQHVISDTMQDISVY